MSHSLSFDDRDVFIVTATLKASAGGRTRSLIQRASILAERTSSIINICSIGYDPNRELDLAEFYGSGRMHESVKVHNIYEDISSGFSGGKADKLLTHDKHDEGFEIIEETKYRILHFKAGVKKYLKDFDKLSGKLHHINYYAELTGNVTHRDHYDLKGFVHRRDVFNNEGALFQEIYYDRLGEAYLTKQFKGTRDSKRLEKVFYFGHFLPRNVFKSISDFYTCWLSTKVDKKTVFICDARIMDESVLNIESHKALKVFQLHNNYHQNPMDLLSPIKPRALTLCKRAKDANLIVALTNDQMIDFLRASEMPEAKGAYIPHSISKKDIVCQRQRTRIVMVARLADQKRISHGVLAFKKFKSNHPCFTLHIYGEGSDEASLRRLIEAEGLSDSCFLEGYTSEAGHRFQEAAFSLVSSKFEGFPLSVMESLANGCPVVSYDINFGPRDMIKKGENGFLAKAGDIDDLSAKMSAIVTSDVLGRDELVQDSIAELSDEVFAKKWCDVINAV